MKKTFAELSRKLEEHSHKRQATEEALRRARDTVASLQLEERSLQDRHAAAKAELESLHQAASQLNEPGFGVRLNPDCPLDRPYPH